MFFKFLIDSWKKNFLIKLILLIVCVLYFFNVLNILIVQVGIFLMLLYYYINDFILNDTNFENIDWNYFKRHKFTSNMLKTEDLSDGYFRLLSTDNDITLPYNSWIRVLVTSMDVLHSWAVPSLGIKLDACPGRLNQVAIFLKRDGFFYGQCSEICGIYHAFMPISIESINIEAFIFWVYGNLETVKEILSS